MCRVFQTLGLNTVGKRTLDDWAQLNTNYFCTLELIEHSVQRGTECKFLLPLET